MSHLLRWRISHAFKTLAPLTGYGGVSTRACPAFDAVTWIRTSRALSRRSTWTRQAESVTEWRQRQGKNRTATYRSPKQVQRRDGRVTVPGQAFRYSPKRRPLPAQRCRRLPDPGLGSDAPMGAAKPRRGKSTADSPAPRAETLPLCSHMQCATPWTLP